MGGLGNSQLDSTRLNYTSTRQPPFLENYRHLTDDFSQWTGLTRFRGGKGIIALFAWYNEGESRLRWYTVWRHSSPGSQCLLHFPVWFARHGVRHEYVTGRSPRQWSSRTTLNSDSGRNGPRASLLLCWIYDKALVSVLLVELYRE